jgi:hypothetical protein
MDHALTSALTPKGEDLGYTDLPQHQTGPEGCGHVMTNVALFIYTYTIKRN